MARFILITAVLLFAAHPHAHALTQMEALQQAAAVQKQGSDESLQNSTTNAMRAMLALGEQNQPAAVQHGYKSFGEYRTSQDLDADRIRSRIRQIDLFTNNVTPNSKVPASLGSPEIYYTTYARLDPGFLRQGEAKQVADQFEKKTGMHRETFLRKMASVSESNISADDPNLTAKVLRKFSAFVDDIPNAEFREKVKAQIEAASPKTKAELVANGAKHALEWLAQKGINLGTKAVAMALPASAEPQRAPASELTAAAGEPVAVVASSHAEDPMASAKKDFTRYMTPTDTGFRGVDKEKFSGEGIGGILQAAIDQENDTLFMRVSRKYRAVAPSMHRWNEYGR